jgi:hypothetical protein
MSEGPLVANASDLLNNVFAIFIKLGEGLRFVWNSFNNVTEAAASLMMEGTCSFETLLPVFHITRRDITEDCWLYVQMVPSNEPFPRVRGFLNFLRD